MKTLILKDNYNTFEQYYLDHLNTNSCDAQFYYTSSSMIRKLFTHYGLPFETNWYGDWKKRLRDYDLVIVFDSLHSANLLNYIHKNYNKRLIFWHWNPIKTRKDLKILDSTRDFCEHWTFNPKDADKYKMKLNGQFFFYQRVNPGEKNSNAFFVGTDKGRYTQLLEIAQKLEKYNYTVDFHVIKKDRTDNRRFIENSYINYNDVLSHIKKSKLMVEIVQTGQDGLTARSLEAMFFATKLITNNSNIKNYPFYNKENIFVLGMDSESMLQGFLNSDFCPIDNSLLFPYSGAGWIDNFNGD